MKLGTKFGRFLTQAALPLNIQQFDVLAFGMGGSE
jgi:hypothetical protein